MKMSIDITPPQQSSQKHHETLQKQIWASTKQMALESSWQIEDQTLG